MQCHIFQKRWFCLKLPKQAMIQRSCWLFHGCCEHCLWGPARLRLHLGAENGHMADVRPYLHLSENETGSDTATLGPRPGNHHNQNYWTNWDGIVTSHFVAAHTCAVTCKTGHCECPELLFPHQSEHIVFSVMWLLIQTLRWLDFIHPWGWC